MRRLREHQFVTIEIDRPSASIECLVLAIDGDEATLEPVRPGQMALLNSGGRQALLTFEHRSQLVTLRGAARHDEGAGDLRFAVTDSVTVRQRRQFARVDVAVPLTLVALRGDGSATDGSRAIETRTRDVSADGVLAEEQLPPSDQRWRMTLGVPDGGPPIVCEAVIVRNVGGGTAMRYTEIRDEDRQRLKEFVAAQKRALLAKLRNQDD